MTLGGTTSGTNAGTYSAKFTLKDTALYQWADGTTAPKTVSWKIGKADGSLTLSKTTITLEDGKLTDSFTVTRLGHRYDLCFVQPSGDCHSPLSGNVVTVTSVDEKLRYGYDYSFRRQRHKLQRAREQDLHGIVRVRDDLRCLLDVQQFLDGALPFDAEQRPERLRQCRRVFRSRARPSAQALAARRLMISCRGRAWKNTTSSTALCRTKDSPILPHVLRYDGLYP